MYPNENPMERMARRFVRSNPYTSVLRNIVGGLVLLAAWSLAHAADPNLLVSTPIGGYKHYVLLPVTAPDFKPHRGLLQNVSDRLIGRMAPLLNQWNYTEASAKLDAELEIALIIDKSKGVSGSMRAMWGPLAGDSDVIAHVDLHERPSGKLVGRQAFFVVRKTSLGTDSEYLMYDDLVNQVVSYLANSYSMQGTDAASDPIQR